MKYLLAFLFAVLSLFGLKQIAHAITSVNVSNNTTGGSNTKVVVNSNVNSTSTNTTTVNSQTRVHIENNGEVKDFNASGDESVDWQSEDGKSSVKINSNSKNQTSDDETEKEITPTISPNERDDDNEATPSVTEAQKKTIKQNASILTIILSWLTSLFK